MHVPHLIERHAYETGCLSRLGRAVGREMSQRRLEQWCARMGLRLSHLSHHGNKDSMCDGLAASGTSFAQVVRLSVGMRPGSLHAVNQK